MIKFCTHSLTFILLYGLVLCAGPKRPRGVSISRAPLYSQSKTFTCLDGKKTIKFDQVNDDYCDCEDSSDEPGTAACPDGQFHCTNAGHRSKYIPSSRVNDGICDCCDGSDEYDSDKVCDSNCLELGRAERQRERTRQDLLRKGTQVKIELGMKGKAMKKEKDKRLAELQHRKTEAEAIRDEKDSIKQNAESLEKEALDIYRQIQENEKREKEEREALETKNEAEEIFEKFDSNRDSFIDLKEIQTRIAFDQNRDGFVTEDEAMFFLDEKDKVDRETFITVCWSRIKPYLMLDSGLFKPPHKKTDEENKQAEEKSNEPQINEDNNIDQDHIGDTHNDNGDQLTEDQREETELLNEEDDYNDEEQEENEETDSGHEGEVEEVKHEPEYDPETQRLIDAANAARTDFHDAEHNVRKIDNEIKDIQDSLDKDYGVNHEFATLEGECFDFDEREYIYKLCPFDKASQHPKNGGGETRLGTWAQWDGKDYKYSHMLYNNGASCWNGPQRSALVEVDCGLENRLTSVSEPNRCEYKFTFETPAACHIGEEILDENLEDIHEEL